MSRFKSLLSPLLFTLFFILFLFAHNRDQLLYSDLVIPLLVGLGMVVGTLFVFRVVYGSFERAAIASTLTLVLFLAYGHAFEIQGEGDYWIRHRYLMPVWGVLYIAGLVLIWKIKKSLDTFLQGLNLVGATLVVMPLVTVIWFEITFKESPHQQLPEIAKNVELEYIPDIYYILPDAYSSEWALRKFYGYDNSQFRRFLEERGFYVVPKPRSNYTGTAFTMSSLLNLKYLEELSKNGIVSRDNTNPRVLIANNIVGSILQSHGYKYIHLGTWWEGDSRILRADQNINKGPMSEFMLLLFRKTIAFPFSYNLGYLDDRRLQHRRILYQFDEVIKIPQNKKPTFTFFHSGAPHGPIVFQEDGSFIAIPDQELDDENVKNPAVQKKYYPGQLAYVTSKLEFLVDNILQNSEHPPIIIIQSDHGSSLFQRSDPDYERNRLKNFSAFYMPEIKDTQGKIHGGRKVVWENITPINTFRLIFNEYFGTNLEYLSDRSYAIANKEGEHPDWDLVDVTEKVEADYK